jgi:hypothetical protein
MGASAKLQTTEEPFEAVRLLEALDSCAQSLVVLENGRVLYANCAFRKEVGIARSSNLRGQLLADLISQAPRHLDQRPTASGLTRDQKQIETSRPYFQANERIFQVICTPSIHQLNSRVDHQNH